MAVAVGAVGANALAGRITRVAGDTLAAVLFRVDVGRAALADAASPQVAAGARATCVGVAAGRGRVVGAVRRRALEVALRVRLVAAGAGVAVGPSEARGADTAGRPGPGASTGTAAGALHAADRRGAVVAVLGVCAEPLAVGVASVARCTCGAVRSAVVDVRAHRARRRLPLVLAQAAAARVGVALHSERVV